jgi:hypothetical protein
MIFVSFLEKTKIGLRPAKGWVVHPLKSHMSWVQYVARQYGSIFWERLPLERKDL